MIATQPQVQMTDDQRQHFADNGYVLIENALEPFGLDRVRAAYEHAQRATEKAWQEMVDSGVYKGGYGHGPDAHTMSGVYKFDTIFSRYCRKSAGHAARRSGSWPRHPEYGDCGPLSPCGDQCPYRVASRLATLSPPAILSQGQSLLLSGRSG